ncbi:hypothetical protein [[Acholeplasma] multilocale]|uniref:hypothetical protein n=1 Tax=[Acholeplasma] multilocale TaxID=264638 RepID=UPI00047AF378|nr:hypothetical protein [[Acholeplasma] multilocale]
MNFTYKEIKEGLVKFFTKNESYKTYKSKVSSDVIYLYSPKSEIEVIKISNKVSDALEETELNYIVEKVKANSRQQVKVLKLVINNEEQKVFEDNGTMIRIITDIEGVKASLEPFFANADLIQFETKKDSSAENAFDENQSPEETIKSFKNFVTSVKHNKVTVSWFILFLFVITPLLFTIISTFVVPAAETNSFAGLSTIIFGGTNYSLTILGGQWWRIFTWGFAPTYSGMIMGVLFTLFAGFALFTTSKITEVRLNAKKYGAGKFAIAFIIAYILIGLFASATLPKVSTGGIMPILGIVSGILIMDVAGDKTPAAKFSKMKAIWPVVLLILIPLLKGNSMEIAISLLSLAIGSAAYGILKSEPKKWNWTHMIMFLMLAALLVASLVFIIKPHLIPAYNYDVLLALKFYAQNKVFGKIDGMNEIVQNIGWDIKFQMASNGQVFINYGVNQYSEVLTLSSQVVANIWGVK